MSFGVYNPWEQVVNNSILIEQNLEKYVAFSRESWNGFPDGDSWFGRGFGETNPEYISRYITPYPLNLTKVIFYFDRELVSSWPVGGTVSFQIYKESPAYGVDPPSNPPCPVAPPPPAGTGSQIYPIVDGDWTVIEQTDAICFNHGRDPRNLTSGGLREAAYYTTSLPTVQVGMGDALSFVAKASWAFGAGAEVSAEIYFTGLP